MTTPNPHVRLLTEALEPQWGTRARLLAEAYSRFCDHGNRSLWEAETRAIKTCRIIDFAEHREAH